MGWFNSLGDIFDPVGALATGGNNNTFDSIFNPGGNVFGENGLDWSPDFVNQGETMANNFGSNVADAGVDELRNLKDHFKDNPFQLLTGVDPAATKLWNGVTGSNNSAWVDQLGGETNADSQKSANRGINMEDAGYMATLAHIIAGSYAGGALGNLGAEAYGSVAGDAAEAGNDLGGFTGSNAGGAAELEAGGYGAAGEVGGTSADAQSIFNLEHGTSALNGVGAYQAASNVTAGAGRGAANALDNDTNPWTGFLQGAGSGLAGTKLDYASMAGVDDPLYKAGINGAVNGGVRAGMTDTSNSGYGALVGMLSGLGGQASNYLSSPASGTTGQGSGGVNNMESLVAGLGNLYLAHKNNQGIQSQINDLKGLYSPNSAYAQQLQQQLNRQDAAGGRRSQYGTRSVELQARLAQLASQQAPTLSNLYGQQRANNFNQLAGLYTMGKNSGVYNQLGSMFNQQQNPIQLSNVNLGNAGQAYGSSNGFTGLVDPDNTLKYGG